MTNETIDKTHSASSYAAGVGSTWVLRCQTASPYMLGWLGRLSMEMGWSDIEMDTIKYWRPWYFGCVKWESCYHRLEIANQVPFSGDHGTKPAKGGRAIKMNSK